MLAQQYKGKLQELIALFKAKGGTNDSKILIQITYLLYLRFISNFGDNIINNAKVPGYEIYSFYRKIRWDRFSKETPDTQYNLYNDYVLMFIPNEHAYMAAMTLDNNLWMEAYEKRVVIISPAHVISTLRLIAQLWTRDKQTKNALKIAEEGGKLYDKFVGFVNDMQTVEQSLGKASEAYASAMSKLHTGRGCIVSKVENLKKLGAKTSKTLPSDMLPE